MNLFPQTPRKPMTSTRVTVVTGVPFCDMRALDPVRGLSYGDQDVDRAINDLTTPW